ncbi:MAG: MMPL family transporter [Planctomycetes bacterium]|nr:MMPL family transporter [Planctomycetota bacterium]
MVSSFYRKFSTGLLWIVGLSFPILQILANALPTNNDIETWLPRKSQVRVTYDQFKEDFGAEEVILLGLSGYDSADPLVEAICQRIERLPGIRKCWSPARLQEVMRELDVTEEEIHSHLKGFLVSEDENLIGLVALFSEEGLQDRSGTVSRIREQLEYCQLDRSEVSMSGAPVVVSEMNRLGSRKNNKRFFLLTLFISFCLLYYTLRQWKLSIGILLLTIWAINLSLATITLSGGEMNFILGAMSVMVMVFTLAICIHFLHYYRASMEEDDPLGAAFQMAWKPCCLATLTTTIGLLSLTVSDIGPVQQFGIYAAIGSLIALVAGLGLTPAILTVWPLKKFPSGHADNRLERSAHWLIDHSRGVAVVTGAMVLVTCLGLGRLESRINSLDFLPKGNAVLADVIYLEHNLTSMSTIEAVVDFSDREMLFVEKLEEIRRIESLLREHPAVRHSISLATFFPNKLPDNPLELASLLNRAKSREGNNDYLSQNDQLWRISLRLTPESSTSRQPVLEELRRKTAGVPITFTGISPLLDGAQRAIFNGFWESFAMAFGIISLVMIVSLRSLKSGAVAMIPNLTPLCIVFGTLGWWMIPVDIGMMMTGSIALGIAVDGTFHYMIRYEKHYRRSQDSTKAARFALLQTGAPIFKAAMIASIGMLALMLSNFPPTSRFGCMMATLLLAALLGDLVLLPAVLALRPAGKKRKPKRHTLSDKGPHFLSQVWSTKDSMIHLSDEAD